MPKKKLSFFGFTPRDQRGIAVLVIFLALAGILFWITVNYNQDINKIEELNEDDKKLVELAKIFQQKDSSAEQIRKWNKKEKQKKEKYYKRNLFNFDPNTLPAEKWQNFGLSEKQVASIEKYRKKGGIFRKKEDVKKLYVISDDLYKILEPYIHINHTDSTIKKDVKFKKPFDSTKKFIRFYDTLNIEINSADSALLTKLRGIGPVFALRIIKYRTKLGGFYQKKQLMEVYGMDTTRYNGFEKNIHINSGLIRKININNISFKDLAKHPYFEYHIVKSIFQYKEKKSKIYSLEELKNIELMKDEIYFKIIHYLTVQ